MTWIKLIKKKKKRASEWDLRLVSSIEHILSLNKKILGNEFSSLERIVLLHGLGKEGFWKWIHWI